MEDDRMTSKEFSLMIDLMLTVSKECGEGKLTELLEKYQMQNIKADSEKEN